MAFSLFGDKNKCKWEGGHRYNLGSNKCMFCSYILDTTAIASTANTAFPNTFHHPNPSIAQHFLPPTATITYEIYVSSSGVTEWRWQGRREQGGPLPAEFNTDIHQTVYEEFHTDLSQMTHMVDEFGHAIPGPVGVLCTMVWRQKDSMDALTTAPLVTHTLSKPEPTVEDKLIKYTKHSAKPWRNPCAGCGATGLFWAHETPDGVIVTGDEQDHCDKCKTYGPLVLIDPDLSPTGKYRPHSCDKPSPTEGKPGEGEGGPQAEAEAEDAPSEQPDPIGSGTTSEADPWDNPTTDITNGEDEGESDQDQPNENDYVTHPEMDEAFKAFKSMSDAELEVMFSAHRAYADKAVAGIESGVRPVEVSVNYNDGKPAKPLPGLHHKQLPTIIKFAAARLHVLMVGGAGVGKGKIARQAADALGLEFYALPGSLTPQTPVNAIVGYMNSSGAYVGTMYRQAFEHGGVIFLDELDNAHPACMAAANDGLAIQPGETVAFPDGMVKRHPDFVCIAAANTYGRGPDQNYVARQRGDVATWDRFNVVPTEIDEPLEMTLCSRTGASADIVAEVTRFIRALRNEAKDRNMPLVLGPRASIDMCKFLHVGGTVHEAVDARVRRGMSDQDWTKLTENVRDMEL